MKPIQKTAIILALVPLCIFSPSTLLSQYSPERDSLFSYVRDLIEVDLAEGLRHSRELSQEAVNRNDSTLLAQAHLLEGTALLKLQRYGEAENAFYKALTVARAENDSAGLATSHYLIGRYHHKQGDHLQALNHLKVALNYTQNTHPETLAMSHYLMARIYLSLDNQESASEHSQQMQAVVKRYRLETHRGRSMNLRAMLAMNSGEYDRARAYLQNAEVANRRVGHQEQLAHTYALLAQTWRELGNYEQALNRVQQALATISNTENKEDYLHYLVLYSRLAQDQGQDNLALTTARKADSLLGSFSSLGPAQREVYGQLAATHLSMGDSAAALRNYLRLQTLSDSLRLRNIREMILEQENRDKQDQLENLSSENELQEITISRSKILLLAAGIAIVVISLLLVTLWRSLTRRKRYSNHLLTKNKEINSQKNQLQVHQQELLAKNKQLEELDKNKNKIFSVLSHDLRQPINQIRSILDLMESEELTAAERKHIVLSMRQSLDNSSNALENLLLWSKNQLTGINTQIVDVHLLPQVWQLESHLKPALDAKNLKLELDIPDFFKVPADMNQLDICLKNLVNNAIKFSNAGGSINIRAYQKGDKKCIDVKDEGVGMTPEQLANLRKLNGSFSTVGTMNEKGTGLGVMITQDFMQNQNGDLEVESAPGKGTTFTMVFPKGEERLRPDRSLRKI